MVLSDLALKFRAAKVAFKSVMFRTLLQSALATLDGYPNLCNRGVATHIGLNLVQIQESC